MQSANILENVITQLPCRMHRSQHDSAPISLGHEPIPLPLELPSTLSAPERSRSPHPFKLSRFRPGKHVENRSLERAIVEEPDVPETTFPERQPALIRVSSSSTERQRTAGACEVVLDTQHSGFRRQLEAAPDLAGLVVDA
jgi:hypothetical protein